MSLFGSIGNVVKKVAKGVAGVIDNPVTRAVAASNPALASLGTLSAAVAGNQKALAGYAGITGGSSVGPGFVGGPAMLSFDPFPTTQAGGVVDALTPDFLVRPVGRKRRRMNPLNARAARRAIRRIKAVRRITRDIERSLPKQTARRRAA